MTHLYLIRHGQALTLVDGILNDYGLTPLGVKQAEHLRDRLAGSGEIIADVLIASTFPRARQTAEIIAPSLKLPIIFDDEIQEQRPGTLLGMHIDAYNALLAEHQHDDPTFLSLAPGAENFAQFTVRVAIALQRITHQYEGKTIVLVCHGGVIDNAFTYFMGLDSLRFPLVTFETLNTSITHWQKRPVDVDHNNLHWHLISYNDVFHLRDLASSVRIPWEALSTQKQVEKADQPLLFSPEEPAS